MSKMTKTIAALGVVAGLGVAAMPLSSYALEDTEKVNHTEKVDLTVEVGQSIEITAKDTNVELGEATSSKMAEGGTVITVHTNNETGYNATIKADQARLTSGDTNYSIPSTGASAIPANGISAWGYKIGSITDYVAASTTMQSFANTSTVSAQAGDAYDLNFAVSVAPNQAAGTYTGSVTLTATVNY